MQGYNFTNRVREVLAGARDEAARLRHEDVRSQHLLLALLRDDASVACHVIESFGVSLDDVERRLEETAKVGSEPHENRPQDLAYSSRAKKVLELSMAEARHLEHSYVGTQHLLLGLIREDHGVAFQTLASFGITLDPARKRVLEILGTGMRRSGSECAFRRRAGWRCRFTSPLRRRRRWPPRSSKRWRRTRTSRPCLPRKTSTSRNWPRRCARGQRPRRLLEIQREVQRSRGMRQRADRDPVDARLRDAPHGRERDAA
jgi:Clp amino terminal domain, pathogenicity island component